MSTVIMAKCWPIQLPPTQKSVLISLADNANDQGECWPSIPTICVRTCFSERAVHRAIHDLEEAGHLIADRTNGRHTKYVVTPADAAVNTTADLAAPPQQVLPRKSGTPADAAVKPPQMRQEPPQMRQEPPQQVRSNRKEPSRTVRSNKSKTSAIHPLLTELDEGLARDFMRVRAAHHAPITETAIKAFRREADKAGVTFADAVRITVERNWRGFRAEWIAGRKDAAPTVTAIRRRELL